jgi:Cu2+-exporting ATPase
MRIHPVQNEADRSRDEGRCVHCLLRIPPGDLVTHTVEGEELDFCCIGCRIAYTIIHGAGLGAFYDKRKWEQAGTPEGVFDRRFDDAYLEKFVSIGSQGAEGTGGGSELSLLVEGVRCASCVWVIEKILSGIDGISKARLSYSSHLLAVTFDPEKITPSEVVGAVCSLGYLARPYTITAVEEMERKTKRALLVRFGTAAFLSMQLMGFSIALYSGDFHGIDFESRQMLQWFAFAVSTPVVFYCGWPFLSGGLRALSNRVPDMDLLIAIGVSASYGYSVFSLLFRGGDGEVYFDSSAMIVTFLLVGRLFENMARGRAAAGVHRLMRLAPDTAHRIEVTPEGVKGEKINDVESSALAAGELIRVMPGERFPADGVVKAGVTEVDEAAVTGEPYPVARGPGAKVTSGTMNMSAAVDVLVTGAGADAFVARMAKLVESSQARKPAVQRLADRVAALFVPVVLSIAALTAGGWLLAGAGVDRALLNAVAVLVVACPCALGLATPTAIVVATGRAASRGILFRGGDVLERLAYTTHAAFDKTGTLTVGKPVVCGVDPLDEISEDEVVATAARAELGSNHPIARAIVNEGDARGLLSLSGNGGRGKSGAGAVATPGLGVTLKTGDGVIRVGNKTFMETAQFLQNKTGLPQNNIKVSLKVPLWEEHPTQLQAWVALDGRLLGRIRMEDELRPEAAAAIKRLKRMGFKTLILTGDTLSAGERMGRLLGVDEVHSHLDPEAKAKIVRGEQRRSGGVLMVGDGINDAAALGEASVGCAIGGATDVALETADLVLVHPNLERVAEAVWLARRTLAVIKQNLGWAFVYNIAALTLAVSGRLEPIHAAAAMALSSVCVVANSLRLSKGKV